MTATTKVIGGLLIAVGALALLPVLLIGMMIGTRILSIVFGPVNIWNSVHRNLADANLAGTYQLSEKSRTDLENMGIFTVAQSGFTLHPDHTMEIVDVPALDGFGDPRHCSHNGTGTWNVYSPSGQVSLGLGVAEGDPPPGAKSPSCLPKNSYLLSFQVLGHSVPYRFWYYIGDPDEDQGLTYSRQP
jgi:hypothetical protein